MIFLLLCLTYFTQHDNFQVNPYCCKWHYFYILLLQPELTNTLTYPMNTSFSKRWEMVKNREAWHAAVHGVAKVRQD